MPAIYEFSDVSKRYAAPGGEVQVLSRISMRVEQGEALAIVGSSGSGKSTLLHLMGALDTPSEGTVAFDGQDMGLMDENAKAAFRNKTLGFVFQFHHLLPEFSAVENVAMPALIAGARLDAVLPDARGLLERVGLGRHEQSKVGTMSGGERQRVAIARAVMLKPRVLLADEPTGNLDEATGLQIGRLLHELNRELGMTLVVVTHNRELAAGMDRGLELRAGALYEKAFV